MTSKIYKNFGGGGKKLTRKNQKYLMKLYRKNRTRKHRGGVGKPGPAGTVCWSFIYWNELDSICDYAISQLQNRYGIEEYDEEATNLENLRVHHTNKHVNELNMNLVRQLKLLTKKNVNNGYELTLKDDQKAFLNQFCTDTPCCVISGGGKIHDGRIRLYKTTEDLDAANAKGLVQHYLVNVSKRNRYTGEEIIEPTWLTHDEYNTLHSEMLLKLNEEESDDRLYGRGTTMMNTIASDEVNKDWELYEAAGALVSDKTKPPTMFTGNFHHFRPTDRVAFDDQTLHSDGKVSPTKLEGGGKELPTFESTKTKLKQILEKVKPDNEYYDFSQKLTEELNKIKEKKFNEFVNKIYENFDKIMSIPIKQKGGAGEGEELTEEERKLARQEVFETETEICVICLDSFIHDKDIVYCGKCRGRSIIEPRMGTVVHRRCIADWGNHCPICRNEGTEAVWFNEVDDSSVIFLRNRFLNLSGIQINAMAMQLPFDQMTHEEQALIMDIRDRRRREQVLDDRLASVRHRIVELWSVCLFLFTCRSAGGVLLGQYDYNYTTFLSMFYGSVIVVGLWPEVPGSVSMTDQLTEFIVRILTFLDAAGSYLGGGKKTRRKRYKRKKRTKRKMRKKRGGVKTGDMVKKKYKMDKLDEYGNPTGKKFWKDFKGLVQNIDNEGNTTIYWYADKSTDVLTKIQSNSLKVIQPKPVAIGDMHQADIPPLTGVSYTGDEKFNPLPAHELTHAIKPTGYVSGIPKGKDDGFEGTREWGQKMLAKLKSYD
uniref:RING-type domain-containing protein n=1 Tax=viral metagenome TaxID=1070528 RepID=A0A6C0C4D7_9ZZZZ